MEISQLIQEGGLNLVVKLDLRETISGLDCLAAKITSNIENINTLVKIIGTRKPQLYHSTILWINSKSLLTADN